MPSDRDKERAKEPFSCAQILRYKRFSCQKHPHLLSYLWLHHLQVRRVQRWSGNANYKLHKQWTRRCKFGWKEEEPQARGIRFQQSRAFRCNLGSWAIHAHLQLCNSSLSPSSICVFVLASLSFLHLLLGHQHHRTSSSRHLYLCCFSLDLFITCFRIEWPRLMRRSGVINYTFNILLERL